MSNSKEMHLAISQPTPTLLGLVTEAAGDCYDQTISAKEQLAKLDFTNSCDNVQKEFKKNFLSTILPNSPIAAILDPNKIVSWWEPAVFVFTGGSFRIRSKTSAVAIPLVKDGNPRIEYYNSQRATSAVEWNVGSVIYLAGNSSLISDGCGNTSFLFLLFTVETGT